MSPISPWNVDYAESQCTAARTYGTADKPVMLVFKPSVTDGTTQLLIAQMGSADQAIQHDVLLSTGSGEPLRATALDYGIEKPRRKVRSILLTGPQMRSLANATRLEITTRHAQDYHFELRQMAAIQAKLRECMTDLYQQWQMSPDDQSKVVIHASANLVGLFSDRD